MVCIRDAQGRENNAGKLLLDVLFSRCPDGPVVLSVKLDCSAFFIFFTILEKCFSYFTITKIPGENVALGQSEVVRNLTTVLLVVVVDVSCGVIGVTFKRQNIISRYYEGNAVGRAKSRLESFVPDS